LSEVNEEAAMSRAVNAVYESGNFRLLEEPDLPLSEGQQVRLRIEMPDDLLELAADVYDGLSEEQIAEVERVALDRREFFGEDEAR
jgi:predicted DNA-binding antitoxin AbrB/MazE fold protein